MASPDHERPGERPDRGKLDRAQLEQEKQLAAKSALRWVRTGMTLGIGTGTTAACFIRALGEKVRGGSLTIAAITSSRQSEELARSAGIPITAPRRGLRLDLTVDGADEISPELNLIKGRGGALLREKIVAEASRYFLVIADSSKRVPRLGAVPVPVEVIPFAVPWVQDRIAALGGRPILRLATASPDKPYLTDQQNYILDCAFERLDNPSGLALDLDQIPGVAGHGLFLGCAQAALIGEGGEAWVLQPGGAAVRLSDFKLPF